MLTAKKMRPSLLMATGTVCTASALIVSVWSAELWLTLLTQFVVGLMVPLIQISFNTQILQYSQPSHIGRINGIMTPLYTASMLIGAGMAGVLKTHLSLVGVYCISAGLLVMAFICIVPVARPGIKDSDSHHLSRLR